MVSEKDKRVQKRHQKRVSNRVIFDALKLAGLKYSLGMNMKIASELVATAYGITVANPSDKLLVAAAVQPLIRGRRTVSGAPEQKAESAPSRGEIAEFYDSWAWKRLSYELKLERGRKCECCGASAPQVKIITDHIKPLRHNWNLRLDRSNLQILCDDCNRGKGSNDVTDFRAA